MAVYSRKDFENYINRDKIKKQKIKKRVWQGVALFLSVLMVLGIVFLFLRDRSIYIKEDNYTEAIDYAVQKFAFDEVLSCGNYPRLSYDKKALPTHPSSSVEDKKENDDIYIEYDDNGNRIDPSISTDKEEENSEGENAKQEMEDTTEPTEPNETKPNNNENTPEKEEEEKKIYEYDLFKAAAGKGNYPGYGMSGNNFIQNMRREVCLAIKAYTTMPLAKGVNDGIYRIDYEDSRYDYVYFFLTGETKKVDKAYLSQLDDKIGKNSYNVYHFWISLTSDRSSNIARELLNSETSYYTVMVTNKQNKPVSNAVVRFISGSYMEELSAEGECILLFEEAPYGMAEVRVQKEGYISFPSEIAYPDYETVNIVDNTEYVGKHVSSPLKIQLQESTLGQCSFSYSTYCYEYGKEGRTEREDYYKGHYTIHLTNTETKEELEEIVAFDGSDIYLCNYFETLKKGIYNISIYPTSEDLDFLHIDNVYINEYGISDDGYLESPQKYAFSFDTDGFVTVDYSITDNTFGGLDGLQGDMTMYQQVKGNALKDGGKSEIMLVDIDSNETFYGSLEKVDGMLVGKVDVPQNNKYDVYLSTIYGNILLYNDMYMRTCNYSFVATIGDKDFNDCYSKISIKRDGVVSAKIVNCADASITYNFIKASDGSIMLSEDIEIPSGYYYLHFNDINGKTNEMYLILISEKSNNYTLIFI